MFSGSVQNVGTIMRDVSGGQFGGQGTQFGGTQKQGAYHLVN